jgi:hypothetical protein
MTRLPQDTALRFNPIHHSCASRPTSAPRFGARDVNARTRLRLTKLVTLSLAVLMAGVILFRPEIARADDSVVVSPTTLTFAGQAIGSQSATQALTYTNSGTDSATITSIVITGADGGVAPFVFNPPQSGSVTIAAMETYVVDVAFAPTSAGSFSGTVTANVATQGAVTATLAGTGLAPELSASPNPLIIGNEPYIPAKVETNTLTLSNTSSTDTIHVSSITIGGANPTYYSAQPSIALPVTLSPGATMTVVVDFTPPAAGADPATLILMSDDPVSPMQEISLLGEVGDPLLTPNAASIVLPSTAVGASSTATLVLTNTGFSQVTITGLTDLVHVTDNDSYMVDGGTTDAGMATSDFVVSGETFPLNLSPNATASFTITFAPLTGGPAPGATKSGVLSFSNNDPAWPPAGTRTISLAATATGAYDTLFPQTLSFNIPNGTSSMQTATFFSDEPQPVKITSVAWASESTDAGARDAGDAGDAGVTHFFSVVSGADIGTIINPDGGAPQLVVQFQAVEANVPESDTLLIGLSDPNQPTLSLAVSGTGVDEDAGPGGGDDGGGDDGGDASDPSYCPLCTSGGDACTCSQVGGADRALAIPLFGATVALGLFVARRKRRGASSEPRV